MKRTGNLFHKIIDPKNLELADKKARRGKKNQPGVKIHDKYREANLKRLHEMLRDKAFRNSTYSIFYIREPKEREVFRLPYFPDRIIQHAIMNILEPIFVACFTADTYSCIKGKGIHAAADAVKGSLRRDPLGTTYCLKLDIKKFYPSVDHEILKSLLNRKFKDPDLMWLLEEIIDSASGVPIGNYLSQYLANFYLTYFDHWIKENCGVKHYFRYADDIVILSDKKDYLHKLRVSITEYLDVNLKLTVKGNYQVFPIADRGLDFVGYKFYHDHTKLRKSIKKNFARKVFRGSSRSSIASYLGWAKHADCKHLIKKLMKDFKDFGIAPEKKVFEGNKIDITEILNKEIIVHDFIIGPSKFDNSKGNGKRLDMQIEVDGVKHVTWTISGILQEVIQRIDKAKDLPFKTTIVRKGKRYEFS